jgi:hypothetical protein
MPHGAGHPSAADHGGTHLWQGVLHGTWSTGQGVTTIYNYACMLSPLLVIYTLVAAFFLMRRRSPKWIKATEATISIVLLVPLSKTAFFAFVLWAMALAPRGPGFP